MSFTEVYKQVLAPFLKKYNDAENEKLKKAVLKNAAASVVKNKDELEIKEDLPKDLERVCIFLSSFIFIFSCIFSSL
jgi:SPX domain protein involved in polyphosphate accumulation